MKNIYELTSANGALLVTQYGYKILSDLGVNCDDEGCYTMVDIQKVLFSDVDSDMQTLLCEDGSEFSDTEVVSIYDLTSDDGEPCTLYVPDSWV